MTEGHEKDNWAEAYYFGCWGRLGHYLYRPSGRMAERAEEGVFSGLDGGLLGKGEQVEGEAVLVHGSGRTIVSFWDRSVDDRGNSNSAFIVRGTHALDEVMQTAKRFFPDIVNRFKFQIRLRST